MAKRTIARFHGIGKDTGKGRYVRVKYDSNLQEYQCRVLDKPKGSTILGALEHMPERDYFTDCKEDAIDTARAMFSKLFDL